MNIELTSNIPMYKQLNYYHCQQKLRHMFHSVYGHQDTDWFCDMPSIF